MQNTVRVVSTAEHQYYGRRMYVGDEYDCEKQVAPEFEKVGWIRPCDVVNSTPQTYMTREMVAAREPRVRKTNK